MFQSIRKAMFMEVDATTLEDLSIFGSEEFSVFSHIDFTRTSGGKYWLKTYLDNPYNDLQKIKGTQQLLQNIISVLDIWPRSVNNGTIHVIETFCEANIQQIPSNPNFIESYYYKRFHQFDFSLIRYSIRHYLILIKEIDDIVKLFSPDKCADSLKEILTRINRSFENRPVFQEILSMDPNKKFKNKEILKFGYYLKCSREDTSELLDLYYRLDAYRSMADACVRYKFIFPEFFENDRPFLVAKKLYHPLLEKPEPTDIDINSEKNFFLLTGANMAGKSTLLRAVGIAVYLAHIGMAVPAQSMTMSLFDGLITNIQISDNIFKGESFFYNEVQRIKKTLEKISNGKRWTVLVDELFKGTNVYDAMKCSVAVIKGMSKLQNIACMLSTHLYEIYDDVKHFDNIQFRYFEVELKTNAFRFTYQLKEGVSDDRIGYFILENQGVVELFENPIKAR
jgi:DNA mismatch repair protein MutS